jgi:type IV pilus assembly protein PilY1
MNLNSSLRKVLALLLLSGSLGWMMTPARSAPLAISDNPLFLTSNIPPNVIVTLDDSGSMSRAFTPDVCGNPNAICDNNPDSRLNHRYLKSSHYNPIYYDPEVTYRAPVDANGTALTTTFNNAWVNGYAHILPGISPDSFDLATQYRPTAGLFLHSASKSHQFMNHYTASADLTNTVTLNYVPDVHVGTTQGTNSGTHAPYFIINDYVNQDGSGNGNSPNGNLISVVVNGVTLNNAGWFSGTCSTSTDPDSNNQFKTSITGSVLTLCFRDTSNSAMYGKPITVTHKLPGSSSVSQPVAATDPVGAYYYVFNPANSGCSGTDAQKKVDNDCYTIRMVSATSGPGGTDERQNFANWYSFYRTRNLATIAGSSLAFQSMDESTRIAWQSLHTCRGSTSSLVTTDCEGWETTSTNFSNAIKPFTGQHKQDFYTWLFRLNTNTSTPLHEAMQRAGSYYQTTGENSPYDNNLNASGSGQYSCRKNFHILMTDGIWSDTSVSAGGNLDQSLPHPYSDGNSNSLADLAYKYWSTDLTGLSNNLQPYIVETGTEPGQTNNPKNDPATWQHMVNFTVGLGLTPFLESTGLTWGGNTYSGSYTAIAAGTTAWPTTSDSAATDDGRVADLWHAAINSRGKFFSVDTPGTLVKAFADVKNAIEKATPSAAALAANSTSIETGSLVYQATFDSRDWSGDLVAYPVGFGGVVGAAIWNAASSIPAPASRNILTINGGSGVSFDWAALSSGQKSYLNTDASGATDTSGAARLDWLRGVQTEEVVTDAAGTVTSGIFRKRTKVLGDIINSDPAFAYQEDFGFQDMVASEAASYASYVAGKSSRTPAVFVGSNDGMLHAFQADSGGSGGTELFAYVPNAVYPNLSKQTDPSYVHRYFVDGGPTVSDAYLGGWKTVLVGGLGGGGKSIYALNVSDVANPSASMVMWEFTDADLGLTYSKPQIARLNSGQWVAIFGNGYNSTSERAYLYVVDLGTGALLHKMAAGTVTANGLSTPAMYDTNNDKIADYAYAGDLKGNLWKFDLTSFADQTTPLFVAQNASSQRQPITAQPVLGGHPSGGVLVYFGTGQYLQSADVLDTSTQTFYGIWDNGVTVDRSQLLQQTIVAQTGEFGSQLRETSGNPIDWSTQRGWYMDFTQPSGERIVTQALLRYGRVIFLTLIPSTDVCNAGGESWLMELDAISGARTSGSSFDFNNDGAFDSLDLLASGSTASGIKTSVGITKPPAWFTGTDGKDFKVMTGTTGGIQTVGNKGAPPPGPSGGGALRRTYWLQIQ